MKEDYCSYEVAKLLKEKGFDESCNSLYILLDSGDYRYTMSDFPYKNSCKYNVSSFARPTHQMAMKWLREEHNIIIVIEPHSYNYLEEKTSSYDFSIWYGDNYEHPLTTNYPIYEEAVEAALKYVLENLI